MRKQEGPLLVRSSPNKPLGCPAEIVLGNQEEQTEPTTKQKKRRVKKKPTQGPSYPYKPIPFPLSTRNPLSILLSIFGWGLA
jgi:hypothetical protein